MNHKKVLVLGAFIVAMCGFSIISFGQEKKEEASKALVGPVTEAKSAGKRDDEMAGEMHPLVKEMYERKHKMAIILMDAVNKGNIAEIIDGMRNYESHESLMRSVERIVRNLKLQIQSQRILLLSKDPAKQQEAQKQILHYRKLLVAFTGFSRSDVSSQIFELKNDSETQGKTAKQGQFAKKVYWVEEFKFFFIAFIHPTSKKKILYFFENISKEDLEKKLESISQRYTSDLEYNFFTSQNFFSVSYTEQLKKFQESNFNTPETGEDAYLYKSSSSHKEEKLYRYKLLDKSNSSSDKTEEKLESGE